MQNYDLLMIAVLVGATVFGFWKGMAWQIASLASIVVSYFLSLRFSEQLAPMFGQQAPTNRYFAMLAIYVGSSFIIWMLFRFVAGAIDKIKLETFDKQLGAMFGFAKGVLLCIGITFAAVALLRDRAPAQADAIVGSQSGHYIIALLDKAHTVLPPEIHQAIDPYLNRIEEKLNPNFQPHGDANVKQMWPGQTPASAPAGWPTANGAQQAPQQQQPAWPTSSQTQPAWPTQQPVQQTSNQDPYHTQQEPNPYPGPYSAEAQTGRGY
jgi:membrane protein required for colicin V production